VSATANFMIRVGHSSCLRCEFETDEEQSFEKQDAAMMAHLKEKHPEWMTDGGASILLERMPENVERKRIADILGKCMRDAGYDTAGSIAAKFIAQATDALVKLKVTG
jgi:hypothetical protein